jgi:hypothetical protein
MKRQEEGSKEESMENQPLERWISFVAGSKQTLTVTALGGDLYRLEWTPLW